MMSNQERLFDRMSLPREAVAETENPKMEAYTCLRNRLLPGLIEVLGNNKHHPYPQNIYEVDDVVVLDDSTATGARSKRRMAVAICHARAGFADAKAALDSLLANLEVKANVREGGWECFIEGRRFTAYVDGQPVCWGGELHPAVLDAWGLEMPVAALEVDVELLLRLVED